LSAIISVVTIDIGGTSGIGDAINHSKSTSSFSDFGVQATHDGTGVGRVVIVVNL